MQPDAGLTEAVARFGLGDLLAEPVAVAQAWSNDVFRVHTRTGRYAVKLYPSTWSAGQVRALRDATAYEAVVLQGGDVAMPRPVDAGEGWLVEVATAAGPRIARCHIWTDGSPATRGPLTVDLARAAGHCLGVLHALDVPAGDTRQLPRPDTGRWERAVQGAQRQGSPWADPLRDLTPVVAGLTVDLDRLRHERRPMIMSHRDLDPKNVVLDPAGDFVLTDWDNAGPVLAAVELVVAATSFADTDDGVRALVAAYRSAGGRAPAPDELAIAVEAAEVDWLLRNVEGSLGAGPQLPDQEETAGQLIDSFRDDLAALRRVAGQIADLSGA